MISLTIFLSFLLLAAGCSLYVGGRTIWTAFRTGKMLVAGGRVYDRDESPSAFYLFILAWIGVVSLLVASAAAMTSEWVSRLAGL
jgi:hypothetical protein